EDEGTRSGAPAPAAGLCGAGEIALPTVGGESGFLRHGGGSDGDRSGARPDVHRQADFRFALEPLFFFALVDALFFGFSSRLSRRRSIRSITPVISGSAVSLRVTFFPFIFAAMIFSRFARYSSVYFSGW